MAWRLKDLDDLKSYPIVEGNTLGRVEGTYSFPKAVKMSRVHCKFFVRDNELFILDLGSTNGIKIGIEKLAPNSKKQVTTGDEIQCGEKRFLVEEYVDKSIPVTHTLEHAGAKEPQYPGPTPIQQQDQVYDFSFHGDRSEFIILLLKNSLYSLFSFGIYIPFAKTNLRRFIWKSTTIGKTPFIFKGDGWKLLKAYAILFVIFIVASAGLTFLGKFLATMHPFAPIVVDGLKSVVIGALFLRAQYSAYAYIVNHTSFRSVTARVNKDGAWPYFGYSVLGIILAIPTLGVSIPWMFTKQEQIKWANTSYGNQGFQYSILVKTYVIKWLQGIALTIITFGIYYPWHAINMHRYRMGNLHFADATFHTKANGVDYFVLLFKCFLLIVFTFGLAAPWVFNMTLSFFMNNLSLEGNVDFARIYQGAKSKRGGLSEAFVEALDLDGGVDIV